jgi:hypothetical protein
MVVIYALAFRLMQENMMRANLDFLKQVVGCIHTRDMLPKIRTFHFSKKIIVTINVG